MCGIAGFVQKSPGASELILKRMTDRLIRRGPDGSGYWSSQASAEGWNASLGHRRLSIIDLEGGAQPLSSVSGRLQITFNGEIFNFQSLRSDLERSGHRFKTRSDTEVLLHHFEEFGTAGLARINGMFAFAIWEQERGRLTLARDRAGIKPLYYARLPGGGLAFASELTALIQHPEVQRKISRDALAGYFFSDYTHAPQSILEGIHKLEPGCFLVWEKGKLSDPEPFWRLDLVLERGRSSARELPEIQKAGAELRSLLEASVRRQLIADVPVGVFLSGGIDSSVVAALARKQAGEAIKTFSIAFQEKDYDESFYARTVARHLGTDHREETLSEGRLLDCIDSALDMLDEPCGDPSILPTFLLSQLTVRSVKVALGGDGGDELFAGYPTYRAFRYAKYYERLPELFRKRVVEEMVARLPVKLTYQSFEWKAKRFALRWDADPSRRHLRWMSSTDIPELAALLREKNGLKPREPWVLRWVERETGARLRAPFKDQLNAMLALDFRTYLPGSVLAKVDRASMGNSLEVRPPFLDNEVIDWAFSLPSDLKLEGSVSKRVLKEMARGLLPREIVDRRKKGFAIPLGRWLRGPLEPRMRKILSESPVWGDMIERSTFARWFEEHREGRADRSKPLWSLLVLDHWMRKEELRAEI